MFRKVAAVLLYLSLASPALAGDPGTQSGFYMGARYGSDLLHTPEERDRPGPGLLGSDRRSTVWSAFGGYRWGLGSGLRAGVEAGYADNGSSSITYASQNEYEFRSDEVDLLATLTWDVYRGAFVGMKVGAGRVRQRYVNTRLVTEPADYDSEERRVLAVAAVAVGYRFGMGLEVFVDFRRTFGDDSDTVNSAFVNSNPTPPPYRDSLGSVARVDSVSVGVAYSF